MRRLVAAVPPPCSPGLGLSCVVQELARVFAPGQSFLPARFVCALHTCMFWACRRSIKDEHSAYQVACHMKTSVAMLWGRRKSAGRSNQCVLRLLPGPQAKPNINTACARTLRTCCRLSSPSSPRAAPSPPTHIFITDLHRSHPAAPPGASRRQHAAPLEAPPTAGSSARPRLQHWAGV